MYFVAAFGSRYNRLIRDSRQNFGFEVFKSASKAIRARTAYEAEAIAKWESEKGAQATTYQNDPDTAEYHVALTHDCMARILLDYFGSDYDAMTDWQRKLFVEFAIAIEQDEGD